MGRALPLEDRISAERSAKKDIVSCRFTQPRYLALFGIRKVPFLCPPKRTAEDREDHFLPENGTNWHSHTIPEDAVTIVSISATAEERKPYECRVHKNCMHHPCAVSLNMSFSINRTSQSYFGSKIFSVGVSVGSSDQILIHCVWRHAGKT